ncbi:MAG: hypothetical protein RBR15_04195 [Sphaerochaeta sp.]|nr:hypothetical protein [Sphaerochaeta sp.]
MRIRGFLLALVGFLLACLPLSAAEQAPFSVGIIALGDELSPFADLVAEGGRTYASTFIVPSEAYGVHLFSREQREQEISISESISSAYGSKSEKELEKALLPLPRATTVPSDRVPIIYREVPLEKGYSALLSSFPESRSWFASREKLDALVLVHQTRIASKVRLRLYWYDLFTDTTTPVLDQVVVQDLPQKMQEEIGSALLAKSAGGQYGLLILDGYTSSLSIEVDGQPLTLQGGQALLISGEYTLEMSREGFIPSQSVVTVGAQAITRIPVSLERIPMGEMHLFSSQGKVSWFVDGLLADTSCSLSLAASLVPLVVVAQKEGFSGKTLQIQKPFQEREVLLEPGWMADSSLLMQRQGDFYASLRNTMLIFGLYVASSTLSQTFDVANPLWQSLQVATSGFALVSTLHTIMNLASYVALASTGVR